MADERREMVGLADGMTPDGASNSGGASNWESARNWESDTVPGTAVGSPTDRLRDTVEMPVVPVGPVVVREPSRVDPPLSPQPEPRSRSPRRGRQIAAIVLAGAVLAGGAAAGTWARFRPDTTGATATSGLAAGRLLTPSSITSVDPVGGSGLRQVEPDLWRTQRYRSVAYGGLKPGVGLLADFGTPRRVSAVTLTATAGAGLELWAGDAPSQSPDGLRPAARHDANQGETTLPTADVGAHRYWLIWVPRLAPQDDGFAAELRGLRFAASQ